MATSAERPHAEPNCERDLAAELDELRALPPRSDSKAFLAWIGRLSSWTHDDLPTVVQGDPSLLAAALGRAGSGFDWRADGALDQLVRDLDYEELVGAVLSEKPDRGLAAQSVARVLRAEQMTAHVAKQLATEPGIGNGASETGAYILGMVHRMGEVAVLSVVQPTGDVGEPPVNPAAAALTPSEVAAGLATRWGFPDDLIACFQPAGTPASLRAEIEVLLFAEEIVRGLPSMGRSGGSSARSGTGARRPARLRISKDRLESIVWAAYAECASLTRLLHPWVG